MISRIFHLPYQGGINAIYKSVPAITSSDHIPVMLVLAVPRGPAPMLGKKIRLEVSEWKNNDRLNKAIGRLFQVTTTKELLLVVVAIILYYRYGT